MGNSAAVEPVSSLRSQIVAVRRVRPRYGELHRSPGGFVRGGIRQAFVQDHHDVAPEGHLHIHGGFRREQMRVAIQVRAEEHAFIRYFAKIAQAEDLKAA